MEDISPFCGDNDNPFWDFWWCLSGVSKPRWIPLLACLLALSLVCKRIPRFTSGATPADIVVKRNLKSVQIDSVRPVYTKHQGQRCDNTSDNALIGNNRVAPEWVTIRFWRDSTVFNDSSISSVIEVLMLTLSGVWWKIKEME